MAAHFIDPAAGDLADPLRAKRAAFVLPEGIIYLDGNSLGPMAHAAHAALQQAATHEWAQDLIKSWNTAGWFELPQKLGDRIGRLIGAAGGQTVVCDTTSINIAKALHAGLSLRPGRSIIAAEAHGFPTDVYVAEGIKSVRPDVRLRLEGVDAPRLEDLIDDQVAVVLVNQVDYRTGVLRDMAAVTERIHAAGAVVVWDLCHSAGAMPVDLDGAEADLAVGCSYKYLNGGPGAPAWIYAAQRHHGHYRQPLTGWWGHAQPFAFTHEWKPGEGMKPMLCGTQPILSMRALEGALSVWDDVDLKDVRAKSLALADLFIERVEASCGRFGIELASPRSHSIRGSQVSFRHPHGYEIVQALIARGVVGDFRAPHFLRFGFAPLYLSYADVARAAEHLHEVMAAEEWRREAFAKRAAVT
jgi:kynureninase